MCSALDTFFDYQPAEMLNFFLGGEGGAVILDEPGIVGGCTMILDGSVYPRRAELMITSCFHQGAQSVIRGVAQLQVGKDFLHLCPFSGSLLRQPGHQQPADTQRLGVPHRRSTDGHMAGEAWKGSRKSRRAMPMIIPEACPSPTITEVIHR